MDPAVASVPIPLAYKMVTAAKDSLSNIHITKTQLGAESYPLYMRRSPENGEQVNNISMTLGGSRVDQEIDNRWVIPYNKLLLHSMNCHSNVELCMSIKYVLKYIHKAVLRQCLPYSPASWIILQTTECLVCQQQ